MFVYSMRAGTVRFFAIVGVSLLVLFTLVALVPTLQPVAAADAPASTQEISFENVGSEEERVAFLAQFGWEVQSPAAESTTVSSEAHIKNVLLLITLMPLLISTLRSLSQP